MTHSQRRALYALLLLVILLPLGLAPAAAAEAEEAGEWQSLAAGESRWYELHYAGDRSQIDVQLEVVPEGSASFVVWTPAQVQSMTTGGRANPVGRSSNDPRTAGVLVWSGNFPTAGTYAVQVTRTVGQTGMSHFHLEVSGTGVSVTETVVEETPIVVRSQPAAVRGTLQLTGKLVFQTTYGGTFYSINADGSDLRRITNGIDPAWSPDGSQIAFVRWEEPRGVYVVNADGSGERRIFDWSEARYPSWSADGSQIVFTRQHGTVPGTGGTGGKPARGPGGSSGEATAAWTLGVVQPSEGSFWEPVTNTWMSWTPDWSPVSEQVIIRTVTGLRVQSADGKDWFDLTTNPTDTTPVWSPDGQKVALVRRQHDHWEIYVVVVSGTGAGQVTRLTDTPILPNGSAGSSVSPAWSPDGKSIAFLTDRTGQWEIWVMAADGTKAQPMFSTELQGLKLNYNYANQRAISWTE
jgi:TolB protein